VKKKGDGLYRAIELHMYVYIKFPMIPTRLIARYHRKRTLVGFSKM
jgi:hypothetical protein